MTDALAIVELRDQLRDLAAPNPVIYWCDLLASVALGAASFVLAPRWGWTAPSAPVLLVVATLAWYRAAIFTHELVHLPRRRWLGFRVAWNALCGVPLLVPSFMYDDHAHHHAHGRYGTAADGEYLPFARLPRRVVAGLLAAGIAAPALLVVRFALLVPLSWMNPRLRDLFHARASAMVMRVDYRRALPVAGERRLWRIQELACLGWLAVVAALVATGAIGWPRIAAAAGVLAAVVTLNSLRLLAAHRYFGDGAAMSFDDQIADSLTYARWPAVTALWAPVGLRFHALHHLAPSLPYHALGAAHRRVLARLPAGSAYHYTLSNGLLSSLRRLWREAGTRTVPTNQSTQNDVTS